MFSVQGRQAGTSRELMNKSTVYRRMAFIGIQTTLDLTVRPLDNVPDPYRPPTGQHLPTNRPWLLQDPVKYRMFSEQNLTRLPSKTNVQVASGQGSHWLIESPTCFIYV